MDIDISSTRFEGISIITKILLMILLIGLASIVITNYFIKPYIKLFDDLENGISKAYRGDFTYHIDTKLNNEAGKVANRLNELSEIYKFKKTIELDETKDVIYDRIIHILESKFGIKHLVFFEINNKSKERKIAYNSIDLENFDENANLCRAFRTSTDVYSSDFENICLNCNQKRDDYICLSYTIDEVYSLVLHIQFDTQEEFKMIQKVTPVINNYFEMAKPVIESKILMSILKDTTLRDPMTSLYNRRFLNELLDSQVSSRVKDGAVHAIMMLDIDFFKKVNDTYGHDVGDDVIKRLAKIMKEAVRHSDMPVRYGGEEFLIFLVNTTKEKTIEIANHINKQFAAEVFKTPSASFSKTLSIGISYYPDDGDTLWKTIKYADEALYEAKNTGRDKVVEFESRMHKDGEDY